MAPDPSAYRVPDKGEDESVIKKFMDGFFDHESSARRERLNEYHLSKAMIESVQWVKQAEDAGRNRVVGWTHQQPEDVDDIPKPVTNEILPIYDTEVGRLKNRHSQPRIRSRANDNEGARAAAKKSENVLKWWLDNDNFPRKRRLAIQQEVAFGTGIVKTYLDTDWLDTVRVTRPDAYRCMSPGCSFMTAGKHVNAATLMGMPPEVVGRLRDTSGFNATGERISSYSVDMCPMCGAPLKHGGLTLEEASGKDMFGRPLGMDVPKNSPAMEVPSPFEMFFENEGIGVTPESCNQFGQVTPRSLDWMAAKFGLRSKDGKYYKGSKDGKPPEELRPEDPAALGRQHAILGEWAFDSRGARGASERNLYRSHVACREFYSNPTMRHPMGRSIVMANNLIFMDDDLMIRSKTDPALKIPRVKYSIARYFEKEGEIHGQGLPVPLISSQRRVNMTWSQIISTRERCGVHGILAPRGSRLTAPGFMKGFPGYVVYYESDPEHPDDKIQPFPAQLMDSRVYQELDRTVERMQYCIGVQDVDVGKAPRNLSAASAIKLLQDMSAQRREQRIEEWQDCFKGAWSHLLLLLREYVREPRQYAFLNEASGEWERGDFIGSELAGHADIIVDEEPGYDEVAFERENVIQGINLGLLSVASPYARYMAAKTLGMPSAIAEEQNVQVEDALRKWYAFRNSQAVPAVDPFEDDHLTHWTIYGKQFKSNDGDRLKRESGWDRIIKVVGDAWPQTLQKAEAMEPMLKDMRQKIASGEQQPMVPGIEQALAAPPLPPALEDRILYVWRQMVQAKSSMPMDHPFIAMKAVAEAHRMLYERQQGVAQTQPVAPAPGSEPTEEPDPQAVQQAEVKAIAEAGQ